MKPLMGLQQKMWCDFEIMRFKEWIPGFYTTSRRTYGYIEFTPYSKGNLWKIRYYHTGVFKVFYGTLEKAYCTRLEDCISFIKTI